jgi:hypothetical protein
MKSVVKVMAVEVKMRYLGHDIARHFGSPKKRQTLRLSDDAVYEHLLSLLEKRYERAIEQLYGRKLREKMLDIFIFICEGQTLRTIRDKLINPESEVLVAYADFGG